MPKLLIRLIGISLALLVCVPTAHAQLRLGILGGANFSSLNEIQTENNLISFDNATAFHAGAFLDISLGPVSLRPAAYYLNAGAIFQSANFLTENDFDVVYITFPVDVNFALGVGPIKPYLFAGPEFRLLSSADAPVALKDEMKNFTMGASAGLGLELNLPGTGLTLYPHLRYSFGISDFTTRTYEVQGVTIDTGGDSRVNMWLLSLGVAF